MRHPCEKNSFAKKTSGATKFVALFLVLWVSMACSNGDSRTIDRISLSPDHKGWDATWAAPRPTLRRLSTTTFRNASLPVSKGTRTFTWLPENTSDLFPHLLRASMTGPDVFGFLALFLGFIYAYRFQRTSDVAALRGKLDERLEERTRIACELHDTLLQTLQGSKFVADDALSDLDDLPKMQRTVVQLAEFIDRALLEGRTALDSLQAPANNSDDLAMSLHRAALEWAPSALRVEASSHGRVQETHSLIRDEVLRIASEAIRNSCLHSKARSLSIKVNYGQDLAISISDNGRGLDPSIIKKGKAGRFGIRGMLERADKIGAKLSFCKTGKVGTTVGLLVPGHLIFTNPQKRTMMNRFRIWPKSNSF